MRALLAAGLLAVSGLAAAQDAPQPAAPAKTMHAARPALAVAAAFDAGRLWLASVHAGRLQVRHSDDRGRTFSPPVTVNEVPEAIAADGENRPKLAFAPDGQIYVSWTRSLEQAYSGHVRFSRSLDGGRSFSPPLTVNDNLDTISHRFDAMTVDARGHLHLVWLDKRDAAQAKQQGQAYTGAALYHAVSSDAGASFASNRKLADHSCECCRLGLARDPDGVPVVTWRQIYGKNVRDHALLRLDGKAEPRRVAQDDWAIDACPHHGPALSIAAGQRHVVWFTNGRARQGLFYARADQAGAFGAPLAFGNAEQQAGHPDVLALGPRVAIVWKEFDGRQSLIRGMHSTDGGETWSAARTLATTGGASAHPQLIADGDTAFLAWNTADEGLRLLPVTE